MCEKAVLSAFRLTKSLCHSTPALLNILSMSHFYDAPFAREHAIKHLDSRLDFSPTSRLYSARQYGVDDWVAKGIEQILCGSLLDLDTTDALLLGPATMLLIYQTREKIDRHRRGCAFVCPPVTHDTDSCFGPEQCESGWGRAWWREYNRSGVAQMLLQPRVPMKAIVDRLDELEVGLMRPVCKQLTVSKLQASVVDGGRLRMEEEYIKEVVEAFKKGARY